MTRRAVVLQPMYLPWMGYFGMVETADVFVFYDDVQFVRRSWQRRNRIKVPDGDFTWLTVPVEKDFGQAINEVEIKDTGWQEDHWQSITHSYANAPFFDEYSDILREIYDQTWGQLVELDVQIISRLCDAFGVGSDFRFSSELDVEGEKTNRLVNILQNIEADEYVSGPGAKDYLDPDMFEEAAIDLYWHEFPHPEHEQVHGEFVSHLSAIDLLFHKGPNAGEMIREAESGALIPE
jgi:hypothetical protein